MSVHNKVPTENKTWQIQLENKITDVILCLCDLDGESFWNKVEEKNLSYFIRKSAGTPWGNHFALALLSLSNRNLSPASISSMTTVLNARFRELFHHFQLSSMAEFSPTHVEQYLSGQILKEHSDRQRQSFLTFYGSITFNLNKWVGSKFTTEKQEELAPYVLPLLPFDNRDFSVREKAITTAKNKRKEDTSAVTPLLPEIRAEGHLRWNQVRRLREAFRSAVAKARAERIALPIEFNYDETEYAGERWYFQLVDLKGLGSYQGRKKTYREFNDEDIVLEFIKAEKLDDGSVGDGPWFLDLLRMRLLGNWATDYISEEHKKNCIDYLNQWGYDIKEGGEIPSPFLPRNKGLLIQGFETTRTARLTNRLLINIEPIFVACMFAKFALDIITSSGARMNELLQISYDKDCCVVTIDKSMDPPRKNYIFRLIPKGREEAENYYMPEDVFKFMSEILKTLKDSYKSEMLPDVEFRVNNRKHLMSQNKKYIFQYQNQHINEFSVNAILRFLLHGIVVQTAEGSQVVFKAHLLRHAFATHAAQTEKIPVDIVKTLLHQRDIEVTTYYSAPTKQQISSSIQTLHENWVSYIDIQKGILRAPDELKDMFEEYRERVGTLSKVVGGICTIDSVCPTKMACVGCGAKVPRPEFKEEILAYYNWADESEKRFEKQGLPLEAKKMKIAKNRAKHELDEIRLIEKYQGD
ncbi:site-specific integrase [Paenibacillus sp. NEAU-GSW1]|uniref:site-specific integrase n=1 Tax=Paenibacillus sp. NEAU-GSW1 TaxID=2682486 RepID=UPI0012E25D15|nr:site-specific integrase [Paenibacillus sp. NEAU-GSW1]MUT67095.1 tyrosine-type recombinase/integrase [Paenibacillus sp. NEAU-GSW1]